MTGFSSLKSSTAPEPPASSPGETERRFQGPFACFHCGEPCKDALLVQDEKAFCCQGCLVVHDLLARSGLGHFYDLGRHPGSRVSSDAAADRWTCLDDPAVQQRLLDFTDGKMSRVTFQVPSIHCVACVWLLENLFRLHAGIGRSDVNFPRREVAIRFAPGQVKLSEIAALLASMGYEPKLTLDDLEKRPGDPARRRRWIQIGVAGFAFGNIMLFSFPGYFGMDGFHGPMLRALFDYLSLALALPVLIYSAADYWKSAWASIRQRTVTLDVPIAAGLAALYAQSAGEILSGHGHGYLDSLVALVFFLLCGRAFQQKTHDRLAFDRDYKSFFPLSARRRSGGREESVSISTLRVGDRIVLRNGELIPADARLVRGPALIDYSFVTGESEPVAKPEGEHLYAGGKQVGEAIEVEIAKPVSESYLTSLWNHESFRKRGGTDLNTLTNCYSRRFTMVVAALAIGAALFWFSAGNPARALKAFTSVLIVACPCALALAAPFTLGTAQRLLARAGIFLRNALVLERLAQVDAVVFDKTGTLTVSSASDIAMEGKPLSPDEQSWIAALTSQSTHPHSARLTEWLGEGRRRPVQSFSEIPGSGLSGCVEGHEIVLGSLSWLQSRNIGTNGQSAFKNHAGSAVHVALDGEYRGAFILSNPLRPETDPLLRDLATQYDIALLSGDNEKERPRFAEWFGGGARLHFHQSPADKLGFIRQLQQSGKTVMMVGDGLNDAGALRQSDVGIAVVEKVGAFSPASDVILEGGKVPRLADLLRIARRSTRIVRLSFGISAAYNLVGIGIAAAGILSPLICAILMPLSSVSVVLFACGATRWAAARALRSGNQDFTTAGRPANSPGGYPGPAKPLPSGMEELAFRGRPGKEVAA